MSKKQGKVKRRRFLPFAIFGLLVGAGLAFTLVRWQKKSMPWTAADREESDFSLYETNGDMTLDWPVSSAEVVGAEPGGVGADGAETAGDPTFDGTDSGSTGLGF